MPNAEQIVQAISSLGREYQMKGGSLWLCCPFHKNGTETTPSLKITLEGGDYPPGNFICFGCSPRQSGNWSKLAIKLGLKKKGDDDDDLYVSQISDAMKSKLLGEDEDSNTLHDK